MGARTHDEPVLARHELGEREEAPLVRDAAQHAGVAPRRLVRGDHVRGVGREGPAQQQDGMPDLLAVRVVRDDDRRGSGFDDRERPRAEEKTDEEQGPAGGASHPPGCYLDSGDAPLPRDGPRARGTSGEKTRPLPPGGPVAWPGRSRSAAVRESAVMARENDMKTIRDALLYLSLGFSAALALDRAAPTAVGAPNDSPLSVRELSILGPDGKVVLRLGASADGGVIEVLAASGSRALTFAGSPRGGRIAVLAPDGSRCSYLGCDDKSGAGTLLLCKGDRPGLEAGVGSDGGYVRAINAHGLSAAFFGAAEGGGGVVEAHDELGTILVQLAAGKGGGHVDVRDTRGDPLAVLTAPEEGKGGLLRILRGNGDPVVELGATDLGGQIAVLGGGARATRALALLQAVEMGGQLVVNRADGPPGALVAAFKDGGQLALLNREGSRIVEAAGDARGGELTLRTRDGKDAVKATVAAKGGQVQTMDANGKATTLLGK